MLDMDLHDIVGIASVGENRWLEGDIADRRIPAPVAHPLVALARADAQIVEGVVPAGILGERGIGRVEAVGVKVAD